MSPVELRARSTGEIFALTFGLYRRHFPTFFSIMSLVVLPIQGLNVLLFFVVVIATALTMSSPSSNADTLSLTVAGLTVASNCVAAIVWLLGIFWPWAEGALAFSVIERILGRAPGVRASYGQTRRQWASLWIANLLAQIGISLPFIVVYLALFGGLAALLTVPVFAVFGADASAGISPAVLVVVIAVCTPVVIAAIVLSIVLAINWAFRTPAIVGEGVGAMQGLSRSVAVVRGSRWLIFWRYLLLFVFEFLFLGLPVLIASLVLAVVTWSIASPAMPQADRLALDASFLPGLVAAMTVGLAISFIGSLLLAPFRVIFTTLNYLDLRARKENLPELLAKAAGQSDKPPAASSISSPSPSPQPIPSVIQTGWNWQNVDLDKLTPAQRVGVLFNRIRAEGENAQTLRALALALKEVGDWGGALDSLVRARAIAPADPAIAYDLMLLYRERRDMTAARRMMQEYLRLETDPNALAAVRSNASFKDLLPE